MPRTIVVDAAADPAPDVVDDVAGVLDAGGVVIVPTDTVYGVAARLDRPGAIDRLFALKRRDRTKAVAVLAADAAQATGLLDLSMLSADAASTMQRLTADAWPGALTLVGPRSARFHHVDLGGDATTIGVRVPDSAVVRAVAARTGPLATTSGNRSGDPTPADARAATASLDGDVDLVVDAGPCTDAPSTVLDLGTWPPRVLRQGAYRLGEVVGARG